MPPRVVLCELCGGKFFPHSIDKHLKVCRQKVGVQLHPCPYCQAGVPMLEMDSHILRCREAKAAGAAPTGQSAALQRRLERDRDRQERGGPAGRAVAPPTGARAAPRDDRPVGGGGGAAGPAEFDDAEGRIACRICGRMFAMDRVAKHQAICQKLSSKKPRRVFQVQRTYCAGGSEGDVIGVAAAVSGNGKARGAAGGTHRGLAGKPAPPPVRSNWREASMALRQAVKAAKGAPPMPQWGAAGAGPGGAVGRPSGGARHGGAPGGAARRRPAAPGRPSPTSSPLPRGGGAGPRGGGLGDAPRFGECGLGPPAGSAMPAVRQLRSTSGGGFGGGGGGGFGGGNFSTSNETSADNPLLGGGARTRGAPPRGSPLDEQRGGFQPSRPGGGGGGSGFGRGGFNASNRASPNNPLAYR